jgi:hypothetical protein
VVREEERVRDDAPGNVPREIFLVEQDAHQLGHRERGVGLQSRISASRTGLYKDCTHVVELDSDDYAGQVSIKVSR